MNRLTILTLLLLAVGCVRASQYAGVDNKWREPVAKFETGKTTKSEVLKTLGPPSQIIALKEQTVFYYLLEQSKVRGAVLIVYNNVTVRVLYDRAIFFFDEDGQLVDYAYSEESAVDPKKKKNEKNDAK